MTTATKSYPIKSLYSQVKPTIISFLDLGQFKLNFEIFSIFSKPFSRLSCQGRQNLWFLCSLSSESENYANPEISRLQKASRIHHLEKKKLPGNSFQSLDTCEEATTTAEAHFSDTKFSVFFTPFKHVFNSSNFDGFPTQNSTHQIEVASYYLLQQVPLAKRK